MRTKLNTRAALILGGAMVYLRSKLAMDDALNLPGVLRDVTSSNDIATRIERAARGKIAYDALPGLQQTLDALGEFAEENLDDEPDGEGQERDTIAATPELWEWLSAHLGRSDLEEFRQLFAGVGKRDEDLDGIDAEPLPFEGSPRPGAMDAAASFLSRYPDAARVTGEQSIPARQAKPTAGNLDGFASRYPTAMRLGFRG